jgi:cysteine-rich repeat protein
VGTEECDDGNSSSGDGCSRDCLTEPGWDCTGAACVRLPLSDAGTTPAYHYCGDGIVTGAEECDDGAGNLAIVDRKLGYGSCLADCRYAERCGDGILDGVEQCDEVINDGTYEACNPDCTLAPRCGDGVVMADFGEECEPKTPDDPDCIECRSTAGCGDGVLQPIEQCDDGALLNDGHYGGCSPSCILGPHCGDGIKNGPEDCDDGILDGSYGGCTLACKLGPYCGDGIVNGREECDHGADNGRDGACGVRCCQVCYLPP